MVPLCCRWEGGKFIVYECTSCLFNIKNLDPYRFVSDSILMTSSTLMHGL